MVADEIVLRGRDSAEIFRWVGGVFEHRFPDASLWGHEDAGDGSKRFRGLGAGFLCRLPDVLCRREH